MLILLEQALEPYISHNATRLPQPWDSPCITKVLIFNQSLGKLGFIMVLLMTGNPLMSHLLSIGKLTFTERQGKYINTATLLSKRTIVWPVGHQWKESWPCVCPIGQTLIGLFWTAGHDTPHECCLWPKTNVQYVLFTTV